jgi:dolichol kinase
MNEHADIIVVGAVTGLFCVVFAVAEAWWRLFRPPVEYTRKFMHLTCGVIALPLAWLIADPWMMLLLGIAFMGVVSLTKRFDMLACMHDVARVSHGTSLYPVSVFVTYMIATESGHPEFYVVAIAVLALSDTAASLVGVSYGRHDFLVEDDRKSVEGSLAFFLCTFTIVHICLELLTDLGTAECILCAVYVAGLVTLVELLSLSGADNLFVPIGVIAILLKITTKDLGEMAWQVGLMCFDFAAVTLLLRNQKSLAASGVVGLGLLTYAAHALIGISWAYVLFLAIALYGISGRLGYNTSGVYRVRFVFFATSVLLVWILATNYLGFAHHIAFLPFAVTAVGTLHLVLDRTGDSARRLRMPLALALASSFGVWHHLFDVNAVWWFDIMTIFIGDLLLVSIAGRVFEGSGGVIGKTRRAAAVGGGVSAFSFIVSWGFHALLV